jgi:hypothetical protein
MKISPRNGSRTGDGNSKPSLSKITPNRKYLMNQIHIFQARWYMWWYMKTQKTPLLIP